MDRQAYSLEKGRPRPAYTPRDIHCPGCGAGLTVKDEHAEMVVCDYCGSHLAVTAEEQKVLGKGGVNKQAFPLELGDSFRHKGYRYEVVARMAFIEDGDVTEMTRQYLLYNPRIGTCWLEAYKGRYSLSRATHIMPESEPFDKGRGGLLTTHDGNQWVAEESGVLELTYVDGALPWIARIGDRIAYADFVDKSGSGQHYQAERTQNEIEYSIGRALDIEVVRRATGKPDLGRKTARRDEPDAAVRRSFYLTVMAAAAIVLVVNLGLTAAVAFLGRPVLSQQFSVADLNGEVLSEPFRVDSGIVKVTATAHPRLNNEWMAMNIAIVGGQEDVLHVYDADISYYHGREGGESWSEGGQSQSTYIKVPQPGAYSLMLHAVSARGNANQADRTSHGLAVRVVDGARMPYFFIAAAVICGLILILSGWSYAKWKSGDEDDED
jgi:ribosomal protein S27E